MARRGRGNSGASTPPPAPTPNPTINVGTSSRDRFWADNNDLQAKTNKILSKILKEFQGRDLTGEFKDIFDKSTKDVQTAQQKLQDALHDDLKVLFTDLGNNFSSLSPELQKRLEKVSSLNKDEFRKLQVDLAKSIYNSTNPQIKAIYETNKLIYKQTKDADKNQLYLEQISTFLKNSQDAEALLLKAVNKIPFGNKILEKFIKAKLEQIAKLEANRLAGKSGVKPEDLPFKGKDLNLGGGIGGMFKSVKSMVKSISSMMGGFTKGLLPLTGIAATLLLAWKIYDRNAQVRKQALEVGKSIGQSGDGKNSINEQFKDVITKAQNTFVDFDARTYTTEQFAKQLQLLIKSTPIMADALSEGSDRLVNNATKLAETYGIQVDLGRLNNEYNNDLVKANNDLVNLYAIANKKNIDLTKTMEEVAELANNVRLYFKKGTIEAGKFTQKLQASGTTLKTIVGLLDKQFDYGESLKFANDINRMLGKTIVSSQQVMEAYEAGPESVAKMQDEIIRGLGDINTISRRKLKIIADTMGMSIKEITDIQRVQDLGKSISDVSKQSLVTGLSDAIKTDPTLQKSLSELFGSVDLGNVADLFSADNLGMLAKIAGGTDKLARKLGNEEGRKELIDTLKSLSKEEIDKLTTPRTFEDSVLSGITGILNFVADIASSPMFSVGYNSQDYSKDVKRQDELIKLINTTTGDEQKANIYYLKTLQKTMRDYETKRNSSTKVIDPDTVNAKQADPDMKKIYDINSREEVSKPEKNAKGGLIKKKTLSWFAENGPEIAAPKKSFDKLMEHDYGINLNKKPGTEPRPRPVEVKSPEPEKNNSKQKDWMDTLVETVKELKPAETTPAWASQMIKLLEGLNQNMKSLTIENKIYLDKKQIASSVNKVNNEDFANGNV